MSEETPLDAVIRHIKAALPVGEKLYAQAPDSGIKPYEYAIALGLAMRALCAEYGWSPEHILINLKTLVRATKPTTGRPPD